MKKTKHVLIAIAALLCLQMKVMAQVWNPEITLATQGTTGGTTNSTTAMAVVNGNPAIVGAEASSLRLVYVRASDASGSSWGTAVLPDITNTIQWPSLAVVNGNPAIAYFDNSNSVLKYVRANDANGTSWGTPITVDATPNAGYTPCLTVVNGKPAIVYAIGGGSGNSFKYIRSNDASGNSWSTPITPANFGTSFPSMIIVKGYPAIATPDNVSWDLKYLRATDSNGTAWGSVVTLDTAGITGQSPSMAIVNNRPAIAYYDQTNADLKYIYASDTTGSSWGSSQTLVSTGNVGQDPSMAVINGNPAISYTDGGKVKYIRANDASGSTWASPVQFNSTASNNYSNLCVVNGNPAMSCIGVSGSISKLYFSRSTDISGTAWASAVIAEIPGPTGLHSSTIMVNGNPAVAFYDQGAGDLKYMRANNTTGTSWGSVVTIASTNDVGRYPSMQIVNGFPAISYFDVTANSIKYIRAADANGATWGSPITIGTGTNKSSLKIVNGNPAIAYSSSSALSYCRATDVNGTTWGSPITVDATTSAGPDMEIINGKPAIVYANSFTLKYVRATDNLGTTWGTPVSLSTNVSNHLNTGNLVVVNGSPATTWMNSFNAVKYKYATDSNGTTWAADINIANTSINPFLNVVNGYPAITYGFSSSTNNYELYYQRATNLSGSTWGSQVVLTTIGTIRNGSLIVNGRDVFISFNEALAGSAKFISGSINSWTGASGTTDWFTASNWNMGALPTSSDNIEIPSGLSFYPSITTGTASCKTIAVRSGASLTVSGGTLQVAGAITNNGTFNATGGTIELNGSQAQTINAALNVTNLIINNSAGATISSGAINVLGTYTPTSGTLTTGGLLTLKSTATGTAHIAAGSSAGGYISGNVTTERYIPGRRAFRFLAHPFTSAQSMSALTDDIDITGSGGSPFTSTATNNPSAFYFDVTTGDNTTTGNNPGWTAFTASSNWNQYQAMRVLVRGAKGQGLSTGSYTPSATTIDMTGAINQGDVNMSLTKGSSTNFILVGNPFPSQVNMDALTTTNVGSSFYIWDAAQGVKGGYTSYNFGSSSFNLPSGGAFSTTLSANGSIVFEEADKTSGTAGTMFKTTGIANQVELKLEDSTIFWDRLLLNFDDNAMAAVDYPDATKLYNPDMTFYTLSKDDSMLSIDTRPYVASETIKLGLYAGIKKNFKFTAPNVNMPAGTKLYFTDKLLSTTIEVTPAFEYWFTVDTSSASFGNNRFELNTQGVPTNSIANVNASKLKVKLVPNPTTENVTLYYEAAGKELNIVVTNMMGVKVVIAKAENVNGNITIPTAQLANGIYNVTIYNGSEVMTQKLIKQ